MTFKDVDKNRKDKGMLKNSVSRKSIFFLLNTQKAILTDKLMF